MFLIVDANDRISAFAPRDMSQVEAQSWVDENPWLKPGHKIIRAKSQNTVGQINRTLRNIENAVM